jgi:phospholipase C
MTTTVSSVTSGRSTLADVAGQILGTNEFAQNSFGQNVQHYVIVYQENWSFDSLYGRFPGANGFLNSFTKISQVDKATGQPITVLPQPINNNVSPAVPDTRFPVDLPVLPYNMTRFVPNDQKTGDIVHRFYQEQAQIDGGKLDQFVSWSDNGGLVFSYIDATNLPEGKLAQQYVMQDNLFHSAFGGSFLNHQFLISGQAPVFPNAPANLKPQLDSNGKLQLDSSGKIVKDGSVTPDNFAVNTTFSKNLVPNFKKPTDTDLLPSLNDSDPTKPNYIPTIGDQLNSQNLSWKWYSGGWNDALAGNADPLFQWHHQPFAYFDNYGPNTPGRAAHLQDEKNFFTDVSGGTLPAVSFIKPLGPDNEHPGYASEQQGQQHVADLVAALQNSPYWANTSVIVTYDENGGRWDHVAPPAGDRWGPGTRVPGIVISPFAKRGVVDHTGYETDSILRTIEQGYNVTSLGQRDTKSTPMFNSYSFSPSDLVKANR